MPLRTNPAPRAKLRQPLVVGKDILELLSSAMYVDPLSIFREYVQNAADSLDEATELGLYENGAKPCIKITLNLEARSATVRDNGAGIPKPHFDRILTAIGGSRKRGTSARGFRGVGRLAGLGYCQDLVMRSRTGADTHVSCMYWDCKRLKDLLRDPADLTLDEIVHEIVETETLPADSFPRHFFEVEMRSVIRHKNDLILNEVALENYLSQVGPVPFSPSFSFGKEIEHHLAKHNAAKTYTLTLNGTPIFRPHRNTYEARPKVQGRFTQLDFFDVQGISSGTDAIGWVLHSDYLGAIPDRHGIKGLRLRSGNIQIGDCRLLDSAFPEARFNAWTVGECHVLSPKLVPNARRDDFEQNNHYANLLTHLAPKGKEIAKACRDSSAERTRLRVKAAAAKTVNGHYVDWIKARTFFSRNATKPLTPAHKTSIQKMLRTGPPTYAQVMRLLVGEPEPAVTTHPIKQPCK
jgi:molecular chaperone HtpG